MKMKAVVFDLDGTLADTIPLTIYSLQEVARHYTGKVLTDQDILDEFGPPDTEIIKKLVNRKSEDCVDAYLKNFSDNFSRFVKPIEGIPELLGLLHRKGIKIGLFTGRSFRAANMILEKLGLSNQFDIILAGEDTKKPKPDPEGINLALHKLGIETQNAAYVGDFEVDILASREAGVVSVLALWSPNSSKELIQKGPDYYFDRVSDFIEWIEENTKK
ncbi:MAG: HAD-IA family hydrolase [Clostridia bacterium]|nr:HAD-IA family hydrolase [Clostridia bacterium]